MGWCLDYCLETEGSCKCLYDAKSDYPTLSSGAKPRRTLRFLPKLQPGQHFPTLLALWLLAG